MTSPLPCAGTGCSLHGRCTGSGSCACFGNFAGALCDEEVCDSGFGTACEPCVEGVFSETCTAACGLLSTCSEQGRCNPWGRCDCFEGWGSGSCKTCAADTFSYACDRGCSLLGGCSGHGRCLGDSTCECYAGWSGASCDSKDDCELGFAGVDCAACSKDQYASTCSEPCSMLASCSGHGRCGKHGGCVCYQGFMGEDCAECAEAGFSGLSLRRGGHSEVEKKDRKRECRSV